MSNWFLVNVDLRLSCGMSPWLFNLYVGGVMKEVNATVLGKGQELPL